MDTENLHLRVLALYLLSQGGKRIRPSLLFLAAEVGDPAAREPLIHAAAALELMHVASLYHDDVMDRATLRRQVPSANARWGNRMAALAGTFLSARAIAILSRLGPIPNQLTSEAAVRLATGQLMEVENAYNLELSEELHLEILSRKTATLFELPLRLGAFFSGASATCSAALGVYGRCLGLAFQLIDDTLDWVGSQDILGKAPGIDLREGVYSLAIIRGLNAACRGSRRLRDILGQMMLTEEDFREVRSILEEYHLVSEAGHLAEEHVLKAQAALESLPRGPARESLYNLAEFTLSRSS